MQENKQQENKMGLRPSFVIFTSRKTDGISHMQLTNNITTHLKQNEATRMSGEIYRRRLRSLMYLCDVFRALINSLVC